MVVLTSLLVTLLIVVVVFLISALPLYFSVKLLGGRTTLFKTAFISLIVGLVVAFVKHLFDIWGGLIAFILMVLIYRSAFRIGWIRAILAWLLHFVFIVIIFAVLALILIAVLGSTAGLKLIPFL